MRFSTAKSLLWKGQEGGGQTGDVLKGQEGGGQTGGGLKGQEGGGQTGGGLRTRWCGVVVTAAAVTVTLLKKASRFGVSPR